MFDVGGSAAGKVCALLAGSDSDTELWDGHRMRQHIEKTGFGQHQIRPLKVTRFDSIGP